MAPPASFIAITTIPFTQVVTQAMFNVANVQWFKYTALTPIVLGLQTNQGGTFVPSTRIYQADGTTLVRASPFNRDQGAWVALASAGDYYIKVLRTPAGPSDFDFTFTADTRPLDTVTLVPGDLVVNDDSAGYAAAVLDSAGAVKGFLSGVPGGEMGAILPSNVSYWHDLYGKYSSTNKVAVFDAAFAHLASVVVGPSAPNPAYFAVDLAHARVYVKHQAGDLWTISEAGVAAATGYVFADPDVPQALAVNPTGTILYWVNRDLDGVIHALNLTTFAALPTVYTVPGWTGGSDKFATTPNNNPGDLFVMPNGNLVTWWVKGTTSDAHLIVVSPAGALLYTYLFAWPLSIDHLAYISGDPDHILIWLFTDQFLSAGHFGRLTLATGVIDQDFVVPLFSQGQNELTGVPGAPKFGPSASCTFVRIQPPPPPPPTPVRVSQLALEVLLAGDGLGDLVPEACPVVYAPSWWDD